MEMLSEALQQLCEERKKAQEQATKLDQAIVAIEIIVGRTNSGYAGGGPKANGAYLPLHVERSLQLRERDGHSSRT